jgi:hypothetical protein
MLGSRPRSNTHTSMPSVRRKALLLASDRDVHEEYQTLKDDQLIPMHEILINMLLLKQRELFTKIGVDNADSSVFRWLTQMLKSIESELD